MLTNCAAFNKFRINPGLFWYEKRLPTSTSEGLSRDADTGHYQNDLLMNFTNFFDIGLLLMIMEYVVWLGKKSE